MGQDWQGPDPAQVMALAKELTAARKAGQAAEPFPGPYPTDLITAYRIQEAAIRMVEAGLTGWHVQPISPNHAQALKSDYIMGPVFDDCVQSPILNISKPYAKLPIRCFKGGVNALSAQWLVRLKAPAQADRFDWTADDALSLIGSLHIGIIVTGSPYKTLENYGPAAVAADFGGFCGLILGAEIPDWKNKDPGPVTAHWSSGQSQVIQLGTLEDIGARLAFTLLHTNARNRPLGLGGLVALGHDDPAIVIQPGKAMRVDLGLFGTFDFDPME
jgi:2-keto-4-pentenoate hydratase